MYQELQNLTFQCPVNIGKITGHKAKNEIGQATLNWNLVFGYNFDGSFT